MRAFLTLIIYIFIQTFTFAQSGVIKGTVLDEDSKPVIYATVAVYQNGRLITGTDTEIDGNFQLDLKPGEYLIEFKYLGYLDQKKQVSLLKEEGLNLNIILNPTQLEIEFVCCCCYYLNLIDLFDTTSGSTFTSQNGFLAPKI